MPLPTRWELHINVVVFQNHTNIELRSKANEPAPDPLVLHHPATRTEVLQLVLSQEVARRMEHGVH